MKKKLKEQIPCLCHIFPFMNCNNSFVFRNKIEQMEQKPDYQGFISKSVIIATLNFNLFKNHTLDILGKQL